MEPIKDFYSTDKEAIFNIDNYIENFLETIEILQEILRN